MDDGRLIILNLHGVGEHRRELDPGEDGVWLGRDEFAAVLDVAAGRGDVKFTFDDGNASDLDIAAPALLARSCKATFFVTAGLLGMPGYLGSKQLRELSDAGMTIGTHGNRHRSWVGLDEAARREELVDARNDLEQITGRKIDEAACPYGAYDRRTLAALRESGYRVVYTTDGGPARASDWIQARNTIRSGHGADDVRRLIDHRPGAVESSLRSLRLAVKRWR
jgi:peptidoglycan/xylan/chitin deacetylase (PgdA/CDA1 family)